MSDQKELEKEINKEAVENEETQTANPDVEDNDTEAETVEESEVVEENTNEEETDEAEDESENSDEKGKEKKEKKSLFGKKKNPLQDQLDDMKDKYMRQVAEFDNFRKRTEKEKAQMFDNGAASVLTKVLPVVDNFERGLSIIPEDKKDDSFVQGMDMIYKQVLKFLEDMDVKPIEALGKEFDPNLHNAVMQVESDEYEEGVVAQELQKGYTYHDTVIRHSMVAVAK